MGLSGTWYVDGDVAFPDTTTQGNVVRSYLFLLKALLMGQVTGTNGTNGPPPVGSRWTLGGSCDAVTAGMDGSDRLGGGTFNASKWVRAADGVAHTWFVLISPAALGAPLYLCVDWANASLDVNVVIFASRTPFTGGTTLTRPTATQEFGYSLTSFAETTTGVVHRMSRVTNASGMFHIISTKNATGLFNFWFAFSRLLDTVLLDNYTDALHLEHLVTGRGVGLAQSTASNAAGSSGPSMRSPVGSHGMDASQQAGFLLPSTTNLARTVVNPNTGNVDTIPAYLLYVGNSGAQMAWRGKWPDLFVCNAARTVGSRTFDGQQMMLSYCVIPCGGLAITV
ncbi:MAG: hypothetical protein ABW123_11605 [Cystobacter sp.]